MTARTAALAALLLAAPFTAQAFLFGGASDKRAAAMLSGMDGAFDRGDCAAVLDISSSFLGEKPPAAMREKAYRYMGSCYEKTALTDKAIGLYKLALGFYPENIFFASRLAGIYNQAGFPENAAPLFLKVLDIKSDDVGANLGLARAYAALGFLAKAKVFYSRAVVLQNFSDAAVLREYAFCMLNKRDWDEVLFIAKRGGAAAPGSSVWELAEARALAGQGLYEKAVPALEAAIKLEPSRQLRLERALYLLLGGRAARALEGAEAELAAGKNDALASVVKGMALYSLGRKAEAETYFSAARSGGPFTAAIAGSFLAGGGVGTEAGCKK